MFEKLKEKNLTRTDDGMIFGVAQGLANYFGIDVTVMRLILIVFGFATDGFALLLYLILAVIMPKADGPVQKEPEIIVS